MAQTNSAPIRQISGRGELFAEGDSLAEVQYTLIVTGGVTIVPPPGEPVGEPHVAGEIAVLARAGEGPRDLREFSDIDMKLHLDDGRTLDISMTDRIPGGYLVEGQGGVEERA